MKCAAAVGAMCLALSGSALAQDVNDEARVFFEQGREAFDNGRFENALTLFRQSLELSERSELWYNVGITLGHLGRDVEALAAYERYLTEVPDADNRAGVESRLRLLRERLADVQDEPEPVASEPRRRLWTWVATGTVGLFTVLAPTFWAVGGNRYDDLRERCMTMGCTDGQINGSAVRTFDRLTTASIGIAIGAAITAVILFVLESR